MLWQNSQPLRQPWAPEQHKREGEGSTERSARPALPSLGQSKAKQTRKGVTGPMARGEEGRVSRVSRQGVICKQPGRPPAPRRRSQRSGRGWFADEPGGSPHDCRFETQQKGEMRLHPRAYLKASCFNQPESGRKQRDVCLEHLRRFKKLHFTSPPEIKEQREAIKAK